MIATYRVSTICITRVPRNTTSMNGKRLAWVHQHAAWIILRVVIPSVRTYILRWTEDKTEGGRPPWRRLDPESSADHTRKSPCSCRTEHSGLHRWAPAPASSALELKQWNLNSDNWDIKSYKYYRSIMGNSRSTALLSSSSSSSSSDSLSALSLLVVAAW